ILREGARGPIAPVRYEGLAWAIRGLADSPRGRASASEAADVPVVSTREIPRVQVPWWSPPRQLRPRVSAAATRGLRSRQFIVAPWTPTAKPPLVLGPAAVCNAARDEDPWSGAKDR